MGAPSASHQSHTGCCAALAKPQPSHSQDTNLLLVNIGNATLLRLFRNHGDTVGVLLPDALSLILALVYKAMTKRERERESKRGIK